MKAIENLDLNSAIKELKSLSEVKSVASNTRKKG